MQFRKKHFILLVVINLLISIFPVFIDPTEFFKSTAWIPIVIIVLVFSFMLFFLFWFFQYVFTRGKDASIKFHLLSQLTVTVLIIGLYSWMMYERFHHVNKGQTAEEHNHYFLETGTRDEYLDQRYDSLYRKGFAALQEKMDNTNDAWLLRRITKGTTNLPVSGQMEEVCVFYFTYSRKGLLKELVSKHAVSEHINRLLFYDVPLDSLPGVKALMLDKKTSMEQSLSPDIIEKTYSEYNPAFDSGRGK